MTSFEMSIPTSSDSKYGRMKQLVSAIENFLRTKADDSANVIIGHLQAVSHTIDLSIFDPNTNIATEFFISLYQLMNKMDQRSPFTWHCVDVLTNACRNPAARQSFIHTYQFIPSLSRILSVQLTVEKKIRLLRLMQDLSCGIKISWQIPHLPYLMTTLTKLVESNDEEIKTLSMGVLVNLCYRNLPAVYTLMGNVDVKKLLRVCSTLKGVIEIHTCKLVIILDFMNSQVPKSVLTKSSSLTFKSMVETYRTKDAISMRQIVEFFLDVIKRQPLSDIMENEQSDKHLKELIGVLENNDAMDTGENIVDNRDPECMALVFQFFHALIERQMPGITSTFPVLIQTALKWIQTDLVSAQALALLTSIAVNLNESENELLRPLVVGLPVFFTILTLNNGNGNTSVIEHNSKIAGLLLLLKSIVQVSSIRPKVIEGLQTDMVCKVFVPLLGGDCLPKDKASDVSTGSAEAISLYVHAVSLITELAKHDARWFSLQESLIQHKQIHIVLAQALYNGSKEVKKLALKTTQIKNFPFDSVADIMESLNPDNSAVSKKQSQAFEDINHPILSVTQIHQLDEVLDKFKKATSQNSHTNISTSEVMELYDYKLASMTHENRSAVASVEAASERCTYLQHRNAQLSAEVDKFRQMLYSAKQCQEEMMRLKESLTQNLKELSNKAEADKGRLKACRSQLSLKDEALNDCKKELEDTVKRLNQVSEAKRQLDEKFEKLDLLAKRLEENCQKSEEVVHKKDVQLKKANASIDGLSMQLEEVNSRLKQTEVELQARNNELKEALKELATRKQILETITKVASNASISQFS